jgi:hypothetical protein
MERNKKSPKEMRTIILLMTSIDHTNPLSFFDGPCQDVPSICGGGEIHYFNSSHFVLLKYNIG